MSGERTTEDDICLAYQNGLSTRKIAGLFHQSRSSVLRLLQSRGIVEITEADKRGRNHSQRGRELASTTKTRLEAGLCRHCDLPARSGFSYCQRHLDEDGRGKRASKASGKCTSCGNPSLPNAARCAGCREAYRIEQNSIRQRRIADGLCRACGKNPPSPQRCLCSNCLERSRVQSRERRVARVTAGLCVDCGRVAKLPESTACHSCFFKRASREMIGVSSLGADLLQLFEASHGRCAYTNWPLTLGIDATVDHIVPVSSGGPHKIRNLQWVHRDVNQMKRAFPEQHFLALVRAISQYRGEK